jgi:[ribosomal protein S5]-alanine N-acetyltransferase
MELTLKSTHLYLRDFVAEDWQEVYAYTSLPEACQFQPWGPYTAEEARALVQGRIAAAGAKPRIAFGMAIVLSQTGTVIGEGGLNIHSQSFRSGEISYIIHPKHWGHGFATEVASTLLAFGFTTLHLHRIFATCDPRNVASEHVLQKLGMHYEGRMREDMLLRDGWRDTVLYSHLEQEWKESPFDQSIHSAEN